MEKILIVDDEENILQFLAKSLRGSDTVTITASKIEEAEYAIKNTFFDAVIADIRLTGVIGREGLELLTFVREFSPQTKVIIMTGYGSEEIKKEAYEKGASLYLEKPFDLKVLKNKLIEMGVIDSHKKAFGAAK